MSEERPPTKADFIGAVIGYIIVIGIGLIIVPHLTIPAAGYFLARLYQMYRAMKEGKK